MLSRSAIGAAAVRREPSAHRGPGARPRPKIAIVFGSSNRATAATGPLPSLKAMMAALADDFDFAVLANPRLGLPNTARVSRGPFSARRWLNRTPHDVLYLNSLFDREYTLPILLMRRLGLIPARPLLIAPRGELLSGALSQKRVRKAIFLRAARAAGLFAGARFHATSELEYAALRRDFPWCGNVLLAGEICRPLESAPPRQRQANGLVVVFISRISEQKNLDYALKVLASVRTPVCFEIYGPIEDERGYWKTCTDMMRGLPRHIRAEYKGALDPARVPEALARADLFFLPTRGENFGHAIFEALFCGVPVLIGDTTPWRGLEARCAGWDIPLTRPEAFALRIEEFARMDRAERLKFGLGARAVALDHLAASKAVDENRAMFQSLFAASRGDDR